MDVPEEVGTHAGRLATFGRPHHFNKRRASAASKKMAQSTITWPHDKPAPEELARAGFYFKPSSTSEDSVTCYLCGKALDGWDPEDDPAAEHLSHVPECGWAINVCIEARSQDMDRAEEDPLNENMMESRRATFMDAWPHEGKKGWKCKMQKMVEAGWCYSPLPEADDCVHCFYCGVSLDGWEPKDDPWEEHRRRAPECHFFTLVEESNKAGKPKTKSKTGRGRQPRASKASRASTQSNLTTTSDGPSLVLDDSLAEDGDTVLTTASTVSKTGKGRKKATKGKAAAKKARVAPAQQTAVVDESVISDPDATVTAPVKAKGRARATRQFSTTTESFTQDVGMSEIAPKKTRAARTGKASVMDDGETSTPNADQSAQHDTTITSPSAPSQQAKVRGKRQQSRKPTEQVSEIEPAELKTAQPDPPVRKVSRAKAPKAKQQPFPDSAETQEDELIMETTETTRPTCGKKRTSDGLEKLESSVLSVNAGPAKNPKAKATGPKRGRAASKATKQRKIQDTEAVPIEVPDAEELHVGKSPIVGPSGKLGDNASADIEDRQAILEESIQEAQAAQLPPTPPLDPSNVSLTASPQSSDAENHPPSSRPSFTIAPGDKGSPNAIKLPLKPTTPAASPSKRVIAAGLTTTAPWTPVDLEHIFLPSPSSRRIQGLEDKENASVEEIMRKLTSPEKKMSVEQWILWNAEKAEERLRGECERLIGAFEGEGVRALRALEGVECI